MKKLLLTLILTALAMPAAAAAEPRTWNLVWGSADLNGPGLDESGSARAVSYSSPLGHSQWLGYDIRLERLAGVTPESWCVDVDLQAVWTPGNRFRLYAGGGLGGVWSDRMTTETEVATPKGTVTVETSESPSALQWNATLGARLLFDPARGFGMGVEHRRGAPVSQGTGADDVARTYLMLLLPGGSRP